MKAFPRELMDSTLYEEIELVADLVVAASTHRGPMSDAQIDEALGLSCPSRLSA